MDENQLRKVLGAASGAWEAGTANLIHGVARASVEAFKETLPSEEPDIPSPTPLPTPTSFRVFDQMRYAGKPPAAELGARKAKILYQGAFDIDDDGKLPPERHIKQLARNNPDDVIVLDIEHPAWLNKNDWSFTGIGVNRYETITRWWGLYAAASQLFGLYGVTTARNVLDAVAGPGQRRWDWWQGVNNQAAKIVPNVPALFPSGYLFYDDAEKNDRYLKHNVAEARRTGGDRPVYVYVWPQGHSSAIDGSIKNQPIPPKLWRACLESVAKYADGCVIWTKSSQTKRLPWSSVAGAGKNTWWTETERFIRSIA
jgi:hypothetical protein